MKGADVVIHLAFAILGAGDDTRELNVDASRSVFEGRPRRASSGSLYASSVAAYGFHDDNPDWLTEDIAPRGTPEHPYSAQKAEVEGSARPGAAATAQRPWPTRSGRASSPGPRRAR